MPSSLLEGVKQFKETLLDAIKTRLELACVEWQEEKRRILYICLSILGAGIFAFLFLLTFTAALIISTWETEARYWIVWGICLFYGLGSGFFIALIIKQISCAISPFKATLEELRKDCEWLKSTSQH